MSSPGTRDPLDSDDENDQISPSSSLLKKNNTTNSILHHDKHLLSLRHNHHTKDLKSFKFDTTTTATGTTTGASTPTTQNNITTTPIPIISVTDSDAPAGEALENEVKPVQYTDDTRNGGGHENIINHSLNGNIDIENGDIIQANAQHAAAISDDALNKQQPFIDQNELDDNNDSGSKKKSLRQRLSQAFESLIFSYAGVKLLLLAQVFNAGMIATTRLLETASEPPFHPFQVLFARMLITYAGCVIFMYYRKVPDFLLGPKGVRFLLVIRGVLGFFGVFGLYYSVNYLEISDAAVITFLTPTVTAIFAWYFLNEPLIPVEIFAGFLALIGVVIISRPAFLFGLLHQSELDSHEEDEVPEKMRVRAVMVALLGVCGASSVYIIIRKIGRRAHPLISVSYFSLWALIVSTIGLIVTPGLGFVLPRTGTQWIFLILLGICGFLFQFCLTAGIQRVSAGRAAAATYTLMIWTLIWEKVIWDKTPDKWSIAGGSLILGSGAIVALFKWWEKDKINEEGMERRRTLASLHSRQVSFAQPPHEDSDDEDDGGVTNERARLLGGDYDYDENAIDDEEDGDDDYTRQMHRYSFSISHSVDPPIPLLDIPPKDPKELEPRDREEEIPQFENSQQEPSQQNTQNNQSSSAEDKSEQVSKSSIDLERQKEQSNNTQAKVISQSSLEKSKTYTKKNEGTNSPSSQNDSHNELNKARRDESRRSSNDDKKKRDYDEERVYSISIERNRNEFLAF